MCIALVLGITLWIVMSDASAFAQDVPLKGVPPQPLEPPTEQVLPPIGVEPAKSDKLDSNLATLISLVDTQGIDAAVAWAESSRLDVVDSTIRVVIVAGDDVDPDQIAADVAALGGVVEQRYASLTQALVPIAALDQLAQTNGIAWVRPPLAAQPTEP